MCPGIKRAKWEKAVKEKGPRNNVRARSLLNGYFQERGKGYAKNLLLP